MNKARQILTSAINRGIANGQAVIAERPTLACLKERADNAGAAFDIACRPHYADGRWGAYRAFECGRDVPREVVAALDRYHDATQAFYAARDGSSGFLGSRGI